MTAPIAPRRWTSILSYPLALLSVLAVVGVTTGKVDAASYKEVSAAFPEGPGTTQLAQAKNSDDLLLDSKDADTPKQETEEPAKQDDAGDAGESHEDLFAVSRTRFPWTQNWLNRSVQGGPEHDR